MSQSVTDEPNDKSQLVPVTEGMVASFSAETILADSGYYSEEAVREIEGDECGQATGVMVLVPAERTPHGRNVNDL